MGVKAIPLPDEMVEKPDKTIEKAVEKNAQKTKYLPFVDRFPTDLELYRIMTTKLTEITGSRESAREKLDSLAKETAAMLSPEGKKAKPKDRGPEH